MAALNHQSQDDLSDPNGQDGKSNFHNDITYNGQHRQSENLWYWLVSQSWCLFLGMK